MVPLALIAGETDREIQQPMAVVILDGIVTSIFLNVFVINGKPTQMKEDPTLEKLALPVNLSEFRYNM